MWLVRVSVVSVLCLCCVCVHPFPPDDAYRGVCSMGMSMGLQGPGHQALPVH